MRVLIVEDNAFNAFCLRRLLESVMTFGTVTLVNNSRAALSLINNHSPDLVIIDGDLGAFNDGLHCNGPELATILLGKYPHLPIVAWSDSIVMREAFATIFNYYDKPVNEFNTWSKVVSMDRISKTWAYYFGDLPHYRAIGNASHVSYY